jgi:hypothetical protein
MGWWKGEYKSVLVLATMEKEEGRVSEWWSSGKICWKEREEPYETPACLEDQKII